MYSSLFYKEWVKTRKAFILMCVAFAAMVGYILLDTAKQFQASPVNFWEFLIEQNLTVVGYLRYLPLAAGVLLAVIQFTAEMQNKRLKLTLHLPMHQTKILSSMLLFGAALLALLFVVAESVLLAGLRVYLCTELVSSNFWVSLPWLTGGLAAYLITAWICLEPVWKQRIFNAVIGLCCLSFFYHRGAPEAYLPFMPYLALFAICSFFFSFRSAVRFKHGVQ